MNDRQLDMVLGYLNEGAEIDEIDYIYEDIIVESANSEMGDIFNEYTAKMKRLSGEYKKAVKAKDTKEMDRIYKEINKCLDECEKEVNKIKPNAKETVAMDAWLIAIYGLFAFYIKSLASISKSIAAFLGTYMGIVLGKGILLDIKATIKEIRKNGVNAETLNVYKNSIKGNIEKLRKDWSKFHAKTVEKVNKKIAKENEKK